jgi:hypothetical protein
MDDRTVEPRISKGTLLDLAKGRGVWFQDGPLSKRIQMIVADHSGSGAQESERTPSVPTPPCVSVPSGTTLRDPARF